jgi:hypothetical protein
MEEKELSFYELNSEYEFPDDLINSIKKDNYAYVYDSLNDKEDCKKLIVFTKDLSEILNHIQNYNHGVKFPNNYNSHLTIHSDSDSSSTTASIFLSKNNKNNQHFNFKCNIYGLKLGKKKEEEEEGNKDDYSIIQDWGKRNEILILKEVVIE